MLGGCVDVGCVWMVVSFMMMNEVLVFVCLEVGEVKVEVGGFVVDDKMLFVINLLCDVVDVYDVEMM